MNDAKAPVPGLAPNNKRIVTIRNQKGLHARAAAKFVKLVENFDTELTVSKSGQTVSGLSIMGLMMLAAGPGTELELAASGPDANAALDALGAMIEEKFEED